MTASSESIAILGCGTLGEALLTRWCESGRVPRDRIVVTGRRAAHLDALRARHDVLVTDDNAEAAARADLVILTVKPQGLASLLEDPAVASALRGKLVVSAAAGVRLPRIERWLSGARVVRAMPNTPCVIGEGMTVLSAGAGTSAEDLARVVALFSAVGRCLCLDETHLDAVTSLNGSGPAFVFVLIEAMVDGGVMMGLPRATALEIAAQVFRGAATMVLETHTHPAALRDQVTTPAGCTIAGLMAMEDGKVRSVVARAIQEAAHVASTLGPTRDRARDPTGS